MKIPRNIAGWKILYPFETRPAIQTGHRNGRCENRECFGRLCRFWPQSVRFRVHAILKNAAQGMNPKIQCNFEVFSPCDFITRVTQHIPDKSFPVRALLRVAFQ